MNPKALPLMAPEYRKTRRPEDARHGDPRDPAVDRASSTTAPGRRSRPDERGHRPAPVAIDADRARRRATGPGLGIRIRRRLPGIASVLVIAFALLILFGPVLMLALFSFNDSSIISLPWEGFTTQLVRGRLGLGRGQGRDRQLAAGRRRW